MRGWIAGRGQIPGYVSCSSLWPATRTGDAGPSGRRDGDVVRRVHGLRRAHHATIGREGQRVRSPGTEEARSPGDRTAGVARRWARTTLRMQRAPGVPRLITDTPARRLLALGSPQNQQRRGRRSSLTRNVACRGVAQRAHGRSATAARRPLGLCVARGRCGWRIVGERGRGGRCPGHFEQPVASVEAFELGLAGVAQLDVAALGDEVAYER